ncbi:unnamed protein product [Sphagnum troendelagicum]|uniref:Uncharacterized protein n=1 Tax=Sphagnum jensenii TaxID=128206 RepID=A0ABP0VYU7_9BRYO
MALGNLKMDIPESPMREEGNIPSSTEESEVESNNPLLTLGRKTSSADAHTSSVHELLECPICTNFMYPPIHQEHHCSSSSTHPPHLLLLLGNENLKM